MVNPYYCPPPEKEKEFYYTIKFIKPVKSIPRAEYIHKVPNVEGRKVEVFVFEPKMHTCDPMEEYGGLGLVVKIDGKKLAITSKIPRKNFVRMSKTEKTEALMIIWKTLNEGAQVMVAELVE